MKTRTKYIWIGMMLVLIIAGLLSIFKIKLISNALLYYLFYFCFLIGGIYLIMSNKQIGVKERILWIVLVLLLNIIGVFLFMLYTKRKFVK